MRKIKTTLCLILSLILILSSAVPVFAAAPFTDVPSDKWYAPYVEYVYENGLMTGTTGTTFSPDTNMSRAMVVTVLYRLEGEPDASATLPFTDVPAGKYYTGAVRWSYENGIVNGTSDTAFSPDSYITREQLVTIFYRYAQSKELDTSARADLTGYSDRSSIANFAKDAFCWAVSSGIINGTTDTTLSPKGNATRAQCAAILQRFIEWMEENSGKDELVAQEQDYAYFEEIPENAVQDLRYFAPKYLTVYKSPGTDYCRFSYLNTDAIYAYLEMMEAECNCTPTDAFHQSYSGSFNSWGLICNDFPDAKQISQTFAKNKCHIDIWTSRSSYGDTSYRINYSSDLVPFDLGYRIDPADAEHYSLLPQGESVASGLMRMADGSYQTTDGRLRTAVGSATVVREGTGLSASANYDIDGDELRITGYWDEEEILFINDGPALAQDDIFRAYELEDDDYTFRIICGEDSYSQNYNSDYFETISLRVMYYEPEGDAVFYIYARLSDDAENAPKELEALAAVSLAPPVEEPMPEYDEDDLITVNGLYDDDPITITMNDILEIEYNHREWDSSYHTFEWEIIEGAELVKVYGAYDSRTFFPQDTGVVVVRMRYGYSVEEPDVLTGYPRRNPKSKTYTYSIIITE